MTMGQIRYPQPVKLFFGLLAGTEQLLDSACERIEKDFSPIDVTSPVIPFDQTDYYSQEMGTNLLRQWVSVTKPIAPEELVRIKLYTNSLERLFAVGENRQVNFDPGYVSLSKVVLATTKDHAHRLYIGQGIYEEVTLFFRRGKGFESWPWTYPDYRLPTSREFFLEVRESLRRELASI